MPSAMASMKLSSRHSVRLTNACMRSWWLSLSRKVRSRSADERGTAAEELFDGQRLQGRVAAIREEPFPRCGAVLPEQFIHVDPLVGRCETESRVSDQVLFQVGGVFGQVADAHAQSREAHIAVHPFVLQHVHRVGQHGDGAPRAEDVGVGDAAVAVERAVEAGVERHDAAFGLVTAEIREVEVQIPEVEGIRGPGLRIVGACEPCVGKLSVATCDARPGAVGRDVVRDGVTHRLPQVHFDLHDLLLGVVGHRQVVQILRVPVAVVVQDGEVEVAALHLVHQPRLDVRVALVVDVADAAALPFEPREVFEQRRFLVNAGHHRLRDEAVAAEKENLIDRFGVAFCLHDLFQIAAQLSHNARSRCNRWGGCVPNRCRDGSAGPTRRSANSRNIRDGGCRVPAGANSRLKSS